MLRIAKIGDPDRVLKLVFPKEGVGIDFPQSVDDIKMMVNNYSADSNLDFFVYDNSSLIYQFSVDINNEVKEVSIPQTGVSKLEIKGGNDEASIIEICFSVN